jgi:hypothetical protein
MDWGTRRFQAHTPLSEHGRCEPSTLPLGISSPYGSRWWTKVGEARLIILDQT